MSTEGGTVNGPAVAEANPLANALTSFIGSANVQKTLAGLQVAIAGLTSAEGHSIGAKITGMTLGGAYGVAVHIVDYLRAKIGR
jgi:hypothetical protein